MSDEIREIKPFTEMNVCTDYYEMLHGMRMCMWFGYNCNNVNLIKSHSSAQEIPGRQALFNFNSFSVAVTLKTRPRSTNTNQLFVLSQSYFHESW